jgi:hypothetical protein
LQPKFVERRPSMDGVGAKYDDDTGKSRERDRDLRGDAESFARLHSDD